jgi:hypothetical protein
MVGIALASRLSSVEKLPAAQGIRKVDDNFSLRAAAAVVAALDGNAASPSKHGA